MATTPTHIRCTAIDFYDCYDLESLHCLADIYYIMFQCQETVTLGQAAHIIFRMEQADKALETILIRKAA